MYKVLINIRSAMFISLALNIHRSSATMPNNHPSEFLRPTRMSPTTWSKLAIQPSIMLSSVIYYRLFMCFYYQ